MQMGDIIGLVVSVLVAIIGVSAITINIVKKNNSKNNKQSIKGGNQNIQAGGSVNIHIDKRDGK